MRTDGKLKKIKYFNNKLAFKLIKPSTKLLILIKSWFCSIADKESHLFIFALFNLINVKEIIVTHHKSFSYVFTRSM